MIQYFIINFKVHILWKCLSKSRAIVRREVFAIISSFNLWQYLSNCNILCKFQNTSKSQNLYALHSSKDHWKVGIWKRVSLAFFWNFSTYSFQRNAQLFWDGSHGTLVLAFRIFPINILLNKLYVDGSNSIWDAYQPKLHWKSPRKCTFVWGPSDRLRLYAGLVLPSN